MKISVACLPVAGKKNPYQKLMMKGLNNSNNIEAFNGVNNRFYGIFLTWLKFKPNYIHFDWIHSYYVRKNLFLTILFLPNFFFQVIFIKIFTRTKMVWTLHNIFPHNLKFKIIHKIIRIFFAKSCDWIRVFSQKTIKHATKLFFIESNKFKHVPEGDYKKVYPNNTSKLNSRKIIKIDKHCRLYLFIGFIRPYKGLDELIDSFDKLNLTNSKLLIVGFVRDINYYKKLLRKLKNINNENIIIENKFIPVSDMQYYMNSADIIILPFNKIENSGSIILAMGFAKPILAPNIGVISQRLKYQQRLLYDNLDFGLLNSSRYSKKELQRIGKKNLESLKSYKWENFQKEFL